MASDVLEVWRVDGRTYTIPPESLFLRDGGYLKFQGPLFTFRISAAVVGDRRVFAVDSIKTDAILRDATCDDWVACASQDSYDHAIGVARVLASTGSVFAAGSDPETALRALLVQVDAVIAALGRPLTKDEPPPMVRLDLLVDARAAFRAATGK